MPKFIAWSDKYETGIKFVDEDHKRLFKAINDLHDAYEIDDSNTHFADLFDLLSKYVDYRFDREEEVMRSMSYPDLESYIIGYQELTATVHEYAKLYRNDPGAISRKEVLKFLGEWLSGHILKSDMAYIPYLKPDKDVATG